MHLDGNIHGTVSLKKRRGFIAVVRDLGIRIVVDDNDIVFACKVHSLFEESLPGNG